MSAGDIWVAPVGEQAGDVKAHPLMVTPFAEYHAQFSPDDKWVSYVSNESGRDEVYIMPFRPGGAGIRRAFRDRPHPRFHRRRRAPALAQRRERAVYLAPDMQLMSASLQASGDSVQRSES